MNQNLIFIDRDKRIPLLISQLMPLLGDRHSILFADRMDTAQNVLKNALPSDAASQQVVFLGINHEESHCRTQIESIRQHCCSKNLHVVGLMSNDNNHRDGGSSNVQGSCSIGGLQLDQILTHPVSVRDLVECLDTIALDEITIAGADATDANLLDDQQPFQQVVEYASQESLYFGGQEDEQMLSVLSDIHDLTQLPVSSAIEDLSREPESLQRTGSNNSSGKRSSGTLHEPAYQLIWSLARAAEFGDRPGGNHVIRIGCYARMIARAMGQSHEFQELIFAAAPLHDVGGLGIPEEIIRKQGTLTAEENRIMRQHCIIGHRLLTEYSDLSIRIDPTGQFSIERSPEMWPIIEMASQIALSHHEKSNGRGYPNKIQGKDIPLAARIVSLCDSFDSLTSERPFRDPYPTETAIEIIESELDCNFDREVYQAFQHEYQHILQVREALRDEVTCELSIDILSSLFAEPTG